MGRAARQAQGRVFLNMCKWRRGSVFERSEAASYPGSGKTIQDLDVQMLKTCVLALCFVCFGATAAVSAPRFIVAHDATWPPMEFVDAKRNIVGYSVDYIDAAAKEAGFEVEHKSVAWEGIFAGLANNQYDIVASSVTITPDRAKVMDFSIPYYEVLQAVITPKDSVARSLKDMKGKQLGAQIGTTGHMSAMKQGIAVKSYDEIGHAVEALATGHLDGVICDDPTASNYILENAAYAAKLKVAFIEDTGEPEYYGFAVAKGKTETLNLLNKGVQAVKDKGIEGRLRAEWIGH